MNRDRLATLTIVTVVLAVGVAVFAGEAHCTERTESPVCCATVNDQMIDTWWPTVAPPTMWSDEVDGLAIRVRSYQTGADLVDDSTTFVPCWWDDNGRKLCPTCFPVQRYTSWPLEYAWSADLQTWRWDGTSHELLGPWVPCYDAVECNGSPCDPGERDAYLSWPPVCTTVDLPCCGNPDCPYPSLEEVMP